MPLYYARDERLGYSPEWVQLCKRSMASVLPPFNSERVLARLSAGLLCSGGEAGPRHGGRDFHVARELGEWKEKVRAAWPGVTLKAVQTRPRESPSTSASRSRSRSG